MKVLYVDDDINHLEIGKKHLERINVNLEVDTVNTAEEALNAGVNYYIQNNSRS